MGGEPEPWEECFDALPLNDAERGTAYVHIMNNDKMQALLGNKKNTLATCESAVRELLRIATQPPAAQPGTTSTQVGGAAAGGGLTEERMRQLLREDREEREQKAFSSVGSTEAEALLASLDIMEMDGNVVDPVVLPEDCPTCSSFDYSKYCDEAAGTCDLLAHHQVELAKMGVVFGQGGYHMYDLHKTPRLYTIKTASGRSYGGNIDGCLSPFGLMPTSAARQCRIAFEHKQSAKQKQAYRDQQSTEVPQQRVVGAGADQGTRFAAGCKGQAVTAFIGACAYNVFPLIMDLTDGEVHHLLHLKGVELFEWTNLKPQQAYYKLSQLLKDHHNLLVQRSLVLEAVPDEFQAPMKKLRTLRPTSALKEQLDSIVPEIEGRMERLQVTYELMMGWAQSEQLEMPAAVRAMYS